GCSPATTRQHGSNGQLQIGAGCFWAFAVEEDKPSNPIRVRFFGANAEMLAPDHVFAAPKRIRLKSHIQLAGVLVKSSSITSSDVSTHFRPVLKSRLRGLTFAE